MLLFGAAVPLGAAVVDVALRAEQMSRWDWNSWIAYGASLVLGTLGFALLAALVLVTRVERPRLSALVALGATLVLAVSACLTAGFYDEFQDYPSWSDAVFVIQEAPNVQETLGLLGESLGWRVGLCGAGCVALALVWWQTVSWGRLRWQVAPTRTHVLGLLSAASVVMVLRVGMPAIAVASPPLVNDAINVALLAKYYQTRTRGDFKRPERAVVPSLPPSGRRPNVLLLIQESLGRAHLGVYGYPKPTTPALERLIGRRCEEFFVFPRAVTNSSNTSVSIPTLLLGLPPDADVDAFHRAPSLWSFAGAAGYRTFLLSAQSFRYANLDLFLLSDPPDSYWTAEQGADLVNGGGMDDEVFLERVLEQLRGAAPQSEPFFGVVQFNATHYPFLHKPQLDPELEIDTRLGRYDNAVRLLDGLVVRLFEQLAELGVLENTVVLMTSDHGENHGVHRTHRTQSYYEEVAGIPFILHFPLGEQGADPERSRILRANLEHRVQNLDVFPTLLDVMGIPDDGAFTELREPLGGQSLFEPIDPDRVLVSRNVVPIRIWSNEGFGLTRGNQRYIFTEWRGEEWYDLDSDPGERHNQSGLQPLPGWVSDTLGLRPDLAALRRKHSRRRFHQ